MVSGPALGRVGGARTHRIGVAPIDPGGSTTDPLSMSATSPSRINANLVSVWRDGSLVGAAIAERDDSSGWNLVFERALKFTDAERKAGQDTYCITTEAGTAVYGGVSSWTVEGAELKLALDDKTSGELGLAGDLTVSLSCPKASITELGAALREILAPKS
jgi:hypothetical protein